jgi:hypothetical protein
MKSTRKQKEADFQLISVQTKRRIAGLIEMKLTPNTIALFASEYEGYDPLIRLEIVEYIGFLMDKELTLFMAQVRDVPADDVTIKRRKQEFEEKAKNIRRIQDILVDPKNVREPKNSALKAGTAPKAEPKKNEKVLTKVQKDEANDKIKKMLREAEERERANARAEKEAEKRRKELEKAEKANASKKVTKEKVKKDKPAKGDNDSAKVAKEKADNEAYLRRQREVQMDKERQAREYMKREAEKEKLWMELYGKTRDESQKHRDAAKENQAQKPDAERDKTPRIRDTKITEYQLFGHAYVIDELIDPKNRVYLFWFNIKQRVGVGNLFAFIESLPLSKQKKYFKKRLKWLKKIAKVSSAANKEVEKQQALIAAQQAEADAKKAEEAKKLEAEKAKEAKDAEKAKEAEKAKAAKEAEKAKAAKEAEKAKAAKEAEIPWFSYVEKFELPLFYPSLFATRKILSKTIPVKNQKELVRLINKIETGLYGIWENKYKPLFSEFLDKTIKTTKAPEYYFSKYYYEFLTSLRLSTILLITDVVIPNLLLINLPHIYLEEQNIETMGSFENITRSIGVYDQLMATTYRSIMQKFTEEVAANGADFVIKYKKDYHELISMVMPNVRLDLEEWIEEFRRTLLSVN